MAQPSRFLFAGATDQLDPSRLDALTAEGAAETGFLDPKGFAHACSKDLLTADAVVVMGSDAASNYFNAALVIERLINPVFRDTKLIYVEPEYDPADPPAFFALLDHFRDEKMLAKPRGELIQIVTDQQQLFDALHAARDAKTDAPEAGGPKEIPPLTAAEQEAVDAVNARGAARVAAGEIEEQDFKIMVFMSALTQDPKRLEMSYALGRMIVAEGWSGVFGASNVGAMNEFGRGVHEAGGHLTGVTVPHLIGEMLPNSDRHTEYGDETLDPEGLARLDHLVVVDDTKARVDEQLRRSDAVVILPGGIGTFEELAYVLEKRREDPDLARDKAVVIVDQDGFWGPGIAALEADGFVAGRDFQVTQDLDGVKDALAAHAATTASPRRSGPVQRPQWGPRPVPNP